MPWDPDPNPHRQPGPVVIRLHGYAERHSITSGPAGDGEREVRCSCGEFTVVATPRMARAAIAAHRSLVWRTYAARRRF